MFGTTPTKVAKDIFDAAVEMDVSDQERRVAESLGFEIHQLISERVQFMASQAGAYVSYYYFETRKPEFKEIGNELERLLEAYFSSRPGIDPVMGRSALKHAQRRYTVRMPEDLAAIFWNQLSDRFAWDQHQDSEEIKQKREVPALLFKLVKFYAESIARLSFDKSIPLVR